MGVTAYGKAVEALEAEDLTRGMKWGEGIPAERGAQLTKSVRMSLQHEEGNLAIAEAQINGERQLLTGVSGKASPAGTVPAPKSPLFTTKASGAMTRAYDSEVKILEHIAYDLPRDARGTISIYTERAPCKSCQGVIAQFEKRFPGVKVKVTYGK
jgi:hypothetical protein